MMRVEHFNGLEQNSNVSTIRRHLLSFFFLSGGNNYQQCGVGIYSFDAIQKFPLTSK